MRSSINGHSSELKKPAIYKFQGLKDPLEIETGGFEKKIH